MLLLIKAAIGFAGILGILIFSWRIGLLDYSPEVIGHPSFLFGAMDSRFNPPRTVSHKEKP